VTARERIRRRHEIDTEDSPARDTVRRVTIRTATWVDFDAIVELLSARSRAAFGVSQVKAIDVRSRWELPGYERWVAIEGESVVGYAALDGTQDVVHAAAAPDVGDALLETVTDRARARGFDHLSVITVAEDVPLWSLVERNGFEHDRDVLRMWRTLNGDLPEPHWADGVQLRTYTEADGERVHTLLDEAYAGWDANYVARSHEGWLSFMTGHDDFDPALFFLVERDGELVACALHWKEFDGQGWVKDIVVRERERGQGLGKALLQHAFREYAARGVARVGLKVDSTNPTGAPQLYERLGFVTDQRLSVWIKRL
jgi:ribosomal protein S18 acetylase RimI-like enzyme